MKKIEAGADESRWEKCPKCGEPISPYKKVWISYPERVMYHIYCAPGRDV